MPLVKVVFTLLFHFTTMMMLFAQIIPEVKKDSLIFDPDRSTVYILAVLSSVSIYALWKFYREIQKNNSDRIKDLKDRIEALERENQNLKR